MTLPDTTAVRVQLHEGDALLRRLADFDAFATRTSPVALSRRPSWTAVLARGLGHRPFCLEARDGDRTVALLPLAFVRSLLFGRFLVSLPYLNSGGVLGDDPVAAGALVDQAVALAARLDTRYLELRHENPLEHPSLTERMTSKVHMRLPLPDRPGVLWDGFDARVRNQVRKGQKNNLQVSWGGLEALDDFYDVFSRNMRDLGTPVYGRRLFASILGQYPGDAEFCVVKTGGRAIAAALLLHGQGVTEVPSASSLREFNSTNANMLQYWHLLERAVQRGQAVFDFGRSGADSNTYRFKKQWGAEPVSATWQYHVRKGSIGAARPDNPKYQRMIRTWQKLPLAITRVLGPWIVKGIP